MLTDTPFFGVEAALTDAGVLETLSEPPIALAPPPPPAAALSAKASMKYAWSDPVTDPCRVLVKLPSSRAISSSNS